MDNLIKSINTHLNRNDVDEEILPLLPNNSYKALPFSPSRFRSFQESGGTGRTLAFIDGGQAELLSTPSLSVGVIRAVARAYNGMKRAFSMTTEFYACISPSPLKNDVTYATELFPLRGNVLPDTNLLSFASTDGSIRSGVRRASPSALLSVARRFAELELAMAAAGKLSAGDLIVLDGSLQQGYTHEEQLLGALRQSSLEKGIMAVGVSKTNSLLSTSGLTFGSMLSPHHPHEQWWYAPVALPSDGAPHISFARLHQKSSGAFLVESFAEPDEPLFASLAAYSHDPVFLGYPYGLVEADRAARVSNQDASYLRTKLAEKLGRRDITALLSQKNAHEVLDSIRF
ncbi:hypothetical protein J4435_01960 [Candidatus Woesearchaeota archaeon]|nr:hypothetical protein [Candidatus Woesearchaeota archaeon]